MPITANFRDAKARTGVGAGGQSLPTGFYRAKTVEVGDDTNSYIVNLEIVEEGYEGARRRSRLGKDMSKAGNRNTWYSAWASHGFDVAALTASEQSTIDEQNFVGNECCLYIRAGDPNDPNNKWDDVQFVTPEAYLANKEGGASEAAAPVKTIAAPTKAVAPTAKVVSGNGAPTPPAPTGGIKALLDKKKAQAQA